MAQLFFDIFGRDQGVGNMLEGVAGKAKGMGGVFAGVAAAGAAVGAAVVGGAAGLFAVGAVFDDVADTIRVGTGASGEALDGLVDVAKRVGTQVPASFDQIGPVVADLNTRLGLSGDTLQTVASQYLEAGRILGEEVDINATSAAFSAFGIEGEAVSGAMDQLFRVAQATGLGMNELAGIVQSAAPAMQNLGFSFDETAALAGTLDKAGLNTEQVMNSMSKGLVTLAKAGEEPQAAFRRTVDEMQGFIDSGNSAGAIDLAGKVFGTKGATQFIGALQSGKINLAELAAGAGTTSDTILGLGQETADAAESWQLIQNKGLAALAPLGEAVFNLAGQGLGWVAANMDVVTSKVQPLMDGVAGIFGILTSGDFSGPIFGMEEDSAFVGFLFSVRESFQQILPVAQELFAQLGPAFGQIIPLALQLWQAISPLGLIFQIIGPLVPTLAAAFATLVPVIGGLVGQIVPLVTQLTGALVPIIVQLVATVLPPVVAVFAQLVAAVGPFVTMIAGLLIPIVQALLPVITTVFTAVASIVQAAMGIVQGIIQVVTGIISGNWSMVWEGIQNVFAGIWNTIGAILSGAWSVLQSLISAGLGIIRGLWEGAWNGITGFFRGIWDGLSQAVSSGIDGVLSFFRDLPGKIGGFFAGAGQWLWNAGADLVNGLLGGVRSLAGTIGNFFLDLMPEWIRGPFKAALGIASPSREFMGYGRNIGEGVLVGVGQMAGRIQDTMGSLVEVPPLPDVALSGAASRSQGSALADLAVRFASLEDAIRSQRPIAVYPVPGMSEETVGRMTAEQLMWRGGV